MLLVGWGSTMGAIEEAVTRLRAEGLAVSSMHLRFLQPMPSGIREILARFKHVMTIEGNWSDKLEDELIDEDNRRYSALAMMLRSRFLVDIDCWSEARGQPIKPGDICRVAREALQREGPCIMSRSLSHCVIKLHEEHHALEDYQGGVPRWCNGCGDNAILAAMQRLCSEEDLAPENTVFVSGIGCSSRLPHYMKTYGFHGIHGRAFPVAEGIKMARPDLNVFVSTGDGDCCSIGAAHWIHALRYNMNITVVLHDNHVYGLTKKQASPTTPARPEEQHHALRRDARADEPADGVAGRAGRVVHRAGAWTGCPRCCTTSCRRRSGTAASRSCASCSAARSSCPRPSTPGCTTRSARCC